MVLTEREVRIPSGCAVAGVFHKEGKVFSSSRILASISAMKERSNGLGGGFACYGCYPEYSSYTAFHVLFDDPGRKEEFEGLLKKGFYLKDEEPIPTRSSLIPQAPYFHRYFVLPKEGEGKEEERILSFVMHINSTLKDVYIISSGKNMGVFKGVGYPEEIGEFFALDRVKGYSWIAHGRFPTNTPGWWGGAHPFSFLQLSVVHNGELSSYGTNRRFLEMKGYPMTQKTDTEVILSAVDYLLRIEGLPFSLLPQVLAPLLWYQIDVLPPKEKNIYTFLRQMYGSLLLNGPFSIIMGFGQGMMALNDRLKLRSLACGKEGDRLYFASEEAAIRAAAPNIQDVSFPKGGEMKKVEIRGKEKGDAA